MQLTDALEYVEHLIGRIKVEELHFVLQICSRWYCREGEAA